MSTATIVPQVRYERAGAVGRLTIDRPPLNVLDLATLEALSAATEQARADRGLKVLVLEGAGKAFCAGVDVADHTAERVERMLTLFHHAIRGVMAFEAPVIALVHGAALGGGCELALSCDIVLARDDLKLGQPEIRLAVFPPVAAALLPRLIGRQRAMDLVLTGRALGADEALRLGLVSRVIPATRWTADTTQFLEDLGTLSGTALRMAKMAVSGGADLSFGAALERVETLYLNDLMHLPDAREGLAAFLEKRVPVWRETA